MADEKLKFESGATSSERAPMFTLLPLRALIEVTRRFEAGVPKHGRQNWRKGIHDPDWIEDRWNHAITHLLTAWGKREGFIPPGKDSILDDLAAVGWGALALLEAELAARDAVAAPVPTPAEPEKPARTIFRKASDRDRWEDAAKGTICLYLEPCHHVVLFKTIGGIAPHGEVWVPCPECSKAAAKAEKS